MSWTIGVSVRSIAEVTLGRQRSPQHAEGPFMVKYLRAANVKDGELDLSDVKTMNFGPDEQRIYQLMPGDILITEGSGSLSTVGASAVWRGELSGTVCFQNTLLRLRARPEVADGRFLAWWARAAFASGTFASLADGANIYHLSAERVRALRMDLPPLETQRRIADFLDAETARLDRLAQVRRAQVACLQERTYTVWSETIADHGERFGWVPIRRFLTAITDGPFGSALTSSHYADSGARVIRLGNIGRAAFRGEDAAYVPLDYYRQLRRHEAVAGDLVVAGLGDGNHPIGRACVVPNDLGPAIVKADCFRLRLDQERVLHEYAALALSSPIVADQVRLLARGSTRARVNLGVVRQAPIPQPPIAVQRSAVSHLAGLRARVAYVGNLCAKQLELIAERRQTLITAAVTGRFEVSSASGRGVVE